MFWQIKISSELCPYRREEYPSGFKEYICGWLKGEQPFANCECGLERCPVINKRERETMGLIK